MIEQCGESMTDFTDKSLANITRDLFYDTNKDY
jgi:hypothetical protein